MPDHQHSAVPYNFTVNLDTTNFELRIDTDAGYGYFEHRELGDECGGGLWFMGDPPTELYDFDGVAELPSEVEDALKAAGYSIEVIPDFDDF